MTNIFGKVIVAAYLFSTLILSCKKTDQLPDPLEAGWKGKSVCEIIEETEKLRVLKCTFKPNVGHEKHYHKPHVGYTLKGSKFQITDKNGVREINVPTGSTFSKDKTSQHEVLNIGDSTAIFLIIEPK
jgi:quercetin dioxygenase-like cupin family protein